MNRNVFVLAALAAAVLLFLAVINVAAEGKKGASPPQPKSTVVEQDETPPAPADPAIGEQIKWQVISAGGRTGDPVNADTILGGSVGQTAAGTGIVPTCCNDDGIRGDVDYSGGAPNVGDLSWLVAYLFQGGPPPAPCPAYKYRLDHGFWQNF